jgi:hypothetical protein
MELTPKVPPPVETGIVPALINQAQYETTMEISMRKQIVLPRPKTIMLLAPINQAQYETMMVISRMMKIALLQLKTITPAALISRAQSETTVTIKQRHTCGNLSGQWAVLSLKTLTVMTMACQMERRVVHQALPVVL